MHNYLYTKKKKREREREKKLICFFFFYYHSFCIEIFLEVKHAMNEINAAQRERQAAVERGETEKILVVKQAEADSESKYLSGCGIARQRKAIVEGLRDSVLEFAEDVDGASPKDVMDLVLVTQYFDTLKDLGISANNNTVFIPGASSNINNDDISNKFALGMMQGKAANC
eukprot:TRINITY_DN528_c0_g2_i1.p1 TRINITY_DN528_c0_g2~~TRINITY_DN528_c0_g2_i1.p1  ORF type:complete len:171 (+),score=64.57 TRINITY_DN528_c0_g2_i1:566-1078(+)